MGVATDIKSYHAHVYFEPGQREHAAWLRAAVEEGFDVQMGRWRDEPVGPHPKPMYQVAFGVGEFDRLVPFLMLNRGVLDILVHPETGDDYIDHSAYAMWLGRSLPLRLDVFTPPFSS